MSRGFNLGGKPIYRPMTDVFNSSMSSMSAPTGGGGMTAGGTATPKFTPPSGLSLGGVSKALASLQGTESYQDARISTVTPGMTGRISTGTGAPKLNVSVPTNLYGNSGNPAITTTSGTNSKPVNSGSVSSPSTSPPPPPAYTTPVLPTFNATGSQYTGGSIIGG